MNPATPALFVIAADDDDHAQHLRDALTSLPGQPLCIRVYDPSEVRDMLRNLRTHDPSRRTLPCVALLAFTAASASVEVLCWMQTHAELRPARTVILVADRHAPTVNRLTNWGADAVLPHYPSADELSRGVVPERASPVVLAPAAAAWASADTGQPLIPTPATDCCPL